MLFAFAGLLFFCSCDKKQQEPAVNNGADSALSAFDNPEFLLNEAKKTLGQEVKFATIGKFVSDTVKQVVAGIEIENKKEFGIQFALLDIVNGKLVLQYKTGLLDGAFEKSIVQKINFVSAQNDLVYYNSKDYFLGTAMGEVFSYVIDFKTKNTFLSHLFYNESVSPSLFLSPDSMPSEIREYFIKNAKNDFPEMKIVKKNKKLE